MALIGQSREAEIDKLLRAVVSYWGRLPLPLVVTSHNATEDRELDKVLRGRTFDQVDFSTYPLGSESLFVYGTPESVRYYLGSYLIFALTVAKKFPSGVTAQTSICFMHDYLCVNDDIYLPSYEFIAKQNELIERLLAYCRYISRYGDSIGICDETVNRIGAVWVDKSSFESAWSELRERGLSH